MIEKISEIYRQDKILNELYRGLPNIAKKNFLLDCLVEELQNTNDIEGVKSTKEELVKSAKELEKNTASSERFTSMLYSYNKLLSGQLRLLENPKDIRKIYDYLVVDEITLDELPDGEIFRKDVTNIYKSSGTGKVIHRGITPEKEIVKAIEEMIHFLNDEDSVPSIVKIAIAHYYFGYIHPFYDGNGRTSRFISSLYLNKELSMLTAISLSRGCNKSRSKYLESFEKSNSIASNGEMNYFIDTFLEIICSSQGDMIEELKIKQQLLDDAKLKISTNSELQQQNKIFKDIVYVFVQHHYFHPTNEGFTVQELAKIFDKSDQYIRKILKQLLQIGVIYAEGVRPVLYYLNEDFIQ